MIRLILLAVIVGAIYYGYRHIQSLPAEQRRGLWWKVGLGALVGISLLAVLTGRMHWVGGAVAVLLAAGKFGASTMFRLWPLLRATGKDAVFRTEHLEVCFRVRSSRLEGKVIKGPHSGESLEAMPADQLQELADYYQDKDRKSYYLVRVFLQRGSAGSAFGGHQEDSEQSASRFPSNPSRDEALLILGLSGNPSEKDIVAAHRRLIMKLHPDRGGNDYLAARINQAKDVLLKR